MCVGKPKIPKPVPAPERQAMQSPRDMALSKGGLNMRRRRGMWASIFTSPQGVTGAPTVTGTGGGITGG